MHALVPLLLLSSNDPLANAVKGASLTIAAPEPSWGRIYLHNGLAPIQYFRDDFGGLMPPHEVSFYFPNQSEDRFGCQRLPELEQLEFRATNRSKVLIVDRGQCTFEHKVRLADWMGAAALVVVSETDDVSAPVAELAHDNEIPIASVMIRRSAGDMLRQVAKHMTIYGRLIPMTCKRKPYTCKPRYEVEEDYIEAAPARSGYISILKDDQDGGRLGSFLGATYGSVLSTKRSFPLATLLDETQACGIVKNGTDKLQFKGKAVLVPGQAFHCTEMHKVSNAQRRGASVVILMQQDNATFIIPPSVPLSWHAYNLTIPILAVSKAVGAKLANFKETECAFKLRFEVRNGLADAWKLVETFSLRSAWPKRVQQCSETLTKLLTRVRGFTEVEAALKNVFTTVVRGSLHDWEKNVHLDKHSVALTAPHELVQTVEKIQTRDEL